MDPFTPISNFAAQVGRQSLDRAVNPNRYMFGDKPAGQMSEEEMAELAALQAQTNAQMQGDLASAEANLQAATQQSPITLAPEMGLDGAPSADMPVDMSDLPEAPPDYQERYKDERDAFYDRKYNMDLHPQQEFGPTEAGQSQIENMQRWDHFLEDNPEAQQRYAPQEYEARMAEEEAAREARAYREPIVNENGTITGYKPSENDLAQLERGMVAVINPETGEIGYAPAAGPTQDRNSPLADVSNDEAQWTDSALPGAPGRLGPRPDLEGKYEPTRLRTPDGGDALVYQPTEDFRNRLAAQEKERRKERLASRAGISAEDAANMKLADLQAANRRAWLDEKEARKLEVANRARARAGNFAGIASDPRNAALMDSPIRYAMPGGQAQAEVDAATAQAAAAMAARQIGRQGINITTGAQNELLENRVRQEQQANRNQITESMAESYAPSSWRGYDDFTIDEQNAMVRELIDAYGFTEAEAHTAVGMQARKRRARKKLPAYRRPQPGDAQPIE